jgi:hypothetical protein
MAGSGADWEKDLSSGVERGEGSSSDRGEELGSGLREQDSWRHPSGVTGLGVGRAPLGLAVRG